MCVAVHLCPPAASAGSDSAGQAMEAEEIVKLEIEPLEETPSSTPTPTPTSTSASESRGVCLYPTAQVPVLPLPLPLPLPDSTVEEGEIVTEADMPPLTGTHTHTHTGTLVTQIDISV